MHIMTQINKDSISESDNPHLVLLNFSEILHFLFIAVYKNGKLKTFSIKVLLMQTSKPVTSFSKTAQ